MPQTLGIFTKNSCKMSLVLQSIASNAGYSDVIRFFNQQFAHPTSGAHAQIVTSIGNDLSSNDSYLFIAELYTNPATYARALFVTTDGKIIVLNGSTPEYAVTNSSVTEDLFTMGETGLVQVFSNLISLGSNNGSLPSRELQCYKTVSYGNDTYYLHFRDGNSQQILASSRLQGRLFTDQALASYNVKIDKTPYNVIEMLSARNEAVRFTVSISDSLNQDFSYTEVGQSLFVQDTVQSRKSIKKLILEGVVTANL